MHKALTLIELIIAVGIFVIVFLLTTSFVNLAAGQVKSTRTKTLTIDLRNAMETISQKLNSANAKETVGGVTIYGFKVNNNILGIVSTDGNKTTCTFIGKNGDNLAVLGNNCGGQWPTAAQLTQVLNAPTIKITKLEFPADCEMPICSQTPYLTIKIEAENLVKKSADEDIITLQSSYALSADTVKKLKQ